jgi:hypothetical protein
MNQLRRGWVFEPTTTINSLQVLERQPLDHTNIIRVAAKSLRNGIRQASIMAVDIYS